MPSHNLDILDCLANLSNDEVLTPPKVANDMIDMLPSKLFSDPKVRFLDCSTKSGVFLREIAKRLFKGLESQIPNPSQRLKHILTNQLYGLAISEITALMTRRTLYCAKNADSKLSLVKFDTPQGNILFDKHIRHTFKNDRCIYCKASKSTYDRDESLESHAYSFLHLDCLESTHPIHKEIKPMHFDVIITNPPYQLSDGGFGASASPLYNHFIDQAKALKPKHIVMIIPARWYSGGKGLDSFRETMLSDTHIRELHDFPNANDCFSSVDIKGGVCYFHWDSHYNGKATIYNHRGAEILSVSKRFLKESDNDTFVRDNEAIAILHKVQSQAEVSLESIISQSKPFGMRTFFDDFKREKDSTYTIGLFRFEKDKSIKDKAPSTTMTENSDIYIYKYL